MVKGIGGAEVVAETGVLPLLVLADDVAMDLSAFGGLGVGAPVYTPPYMAMCMGTTLTIRWPELLEEVFEIAIGGGDSTSRSDGPGPSSGSAEMLVSSPV